MTPLSPADCAHRAERAWSELRPPLAKLPLEQRRDLFGFVALYLHPVGLRHASRSALESLASLNGEQRRLAAIALGETRSATEKQQDGAVLVANELVLQHIKSFIRDQLNAGTLDPTDADAMEIAHLDAYNRAMEIVGETRLGRPLIRRRRGGGVGPELQLLVWPLYQLLIPLFAGQHPGRSPSLRKLADASARRPQLYPAPLMQVIADLVVGTWGTSMGDVNARQVKSSCQKLLEEHPDLEAEILEKFPFRDS